MDKNELPSSVPLDNALLFLDDIPPVVLRTFARLYALAWKHHYDRTDRLTTGELLALLGLGRRQMYDHIGKLHELGVLDWASDGSYGYIFTFPKNYKVSLPDEETSQPRAETVDAWVTVPPAPDFYETKIGGPPAQQLELPTEAGPGRAGFGSLLPEPLGAEIRTWENAPAAATSSPSAEIRTPGAEIRTWEDAPAAETSSPSAEIRTPGAEIRTWEDAPAAETSSPTAEICTPGAEIRTWENAPAAAISGPTAENRTPSAENRSPSAENRTSGAEIRTWRPASVVVVDNIPDLDLNKQQQQQRVSSPAPTAENRSPSAEIRTWPELIAVLIDAGMWNDLAEGLTANLDVDGVLDALGWIAAVRADRRVRNHGAVLVKQLQAGRHAPVEWRPQGVCAACGVVGSRCTCGANDWMVPAVYYTAAIEPLTEWGRDRWGVCEVCGRVECGGHAPQGEGDVAEAAVPAASSNGAGHKVNGQESRIRGAWDGVARYIKVRYGIDINLAEIDNYEVKVTFAGDERRKIVNVTQSMLNRTVQGFVEVIDAGPA